MSIIKPLISILGVALTSYTSFLLISLNPPLTHKTTHSKNVRGSITGKKARKVILFQNHDCSTFPRELRPLEHGYGIPGTGTPKNLQSGSHPIVGSKTSSFSFGTVRFTSSP